MQNDSSSEEEEETTVSDAIILPWQEASSLQKGQGDTPLIVELSSRDVENPHSTPLTTEKHYQCNTQNGLNSEIVSEENNNLLISKEIGRASCRERV